MPDSRLPIATRLPPDRTDLTYFSTGRAAFSFLLEDVVRSRKVHLPTFICWSLVAAMERRFPDVELSFYPVDSTLNADYPQPDSDEEAIVFVHYFGHQCPSPDPSTGGILLEDLSHTFATTELTTGHYGFGSLRKVYRIADGGFVQGRFSPVYEPDQKLAAWLRHQASDWRDMREAENMTDRKWAISDIDSQSLAVMLATDESYVRNRRLENDRFLTDHVSIGEPLLQFKSDDCPLLHNRMMNSPEERDDLRKYLATHGIFCSIHWPTHPTLIERQDEFDVTGALDIESRILSIPIAEYYSLDDMQLIAETCRKWSTR